MFYATGERDRKKLPHDPFKAIVAPRPIGWISTRALDGRINLAPYSFFNGFSSAPPIVGFSSEGWKDSASFARESGEFVANLATQDLRGPMNETSAAVPRGDNEFLRAGLTMAECRLVAAPRVAESPAALECKVVDVVEIRSVERRVERRRAHARRGGRVSYRRAISPRRPLRHRRRASARALRLPGLCGGRESLRHGPAEGRRRHLIGPFGQAAGAGAPLPWSSCSRVLSPLPPAMWNIRFSSVSSARGASSSTSPRASTMKWSPTR